MALEAITSGDPSMPTVNVFSFPLVWKVYLYMAMAHIVMVQYSCGRYRYGLYRHGLELCTRTKRVPT